MIADLTPAEIRTYYEKRCPTLQLDGVEWRGPCPVHGGKSISLRVSPQTGAAQCEADECKGDWSIVQFERAISHKSMQQCLSNIFDAVGRRNGHIPSPRRTIAAEFNYTSETGDALLYQVVRFEPKAFGFRRPLLAQNGVSEPSAKREWIWDVKGVPMVLYRLWRIGKTEDVFVTEGEKDVETIERFGETATTAPGGPGKWRKSYARDLAGKNVIIVPHNDEAGRRHAADIAESLIGQAKSVRIVAVPGHKDISDWQAAGGNREQLLGLVGNAAFQTPETIAAYKRSAYGTQIKKTSKFAVTDQGVFYLDTASDRTWVCGRLDILAKTRNAEGDDWGRLLRWVDDDGRTHQWAMPMSMLAGDGAAIAERLMFGGLHVGQGKARQLLFQYLTTAEVDTRARCVSQVGWCGDAFVLPAETIGRQEHELVIYQTQGEAQTYLGTAGTLEEWQQQVGRFCIGNTRLVFAAACGFAGPVLNLLGVESGGVHFYGRTSTGKSTALVVGGSVCGGGGRLGYCQSWRATANGLEAIADAHNDLTLFLDELAQLDAKEASDTAYLLANGLGKARMTKAIVARRKLAWNLLFVSTGEITLAEHAATATVKTAAIKGGAEIRLLTIEADAGRKAGLFEHTYGHAPNEFANMLKKHALAYYGTPLRLFLEKISAQKADIQTDLKRLHREMIRKLQPKGCAGEVARAVSRFAAIGVAGELATDFGITGWKAGEVTAAVARCFTSWLELRGTSQSSDTDSAIRQVRLFLEKHGTNRFQSVDDSAANIGGDRAGFRRRIKGPEESVEFLILPEVFRRELCRNYDPRAVAQELLERGHLEPGSDEKTHPYTSLKRLPGLGQSRVYVLRSSILGSEE